MFFFIQRLFTIGSCLTVIAVAVLAVQDVFLIILTPKITYFISRNETEINAYYIPTLMIIMSIIYFAVAATGSVFLYIGSSGQLFNLAIYGPFLVLLTGGLFLSIAELVISRRVLNYNGR